MSKSIQNELISWIKQHIQSYMITKLINQSIGPLFRIMAGKVTDVSNVEQLGLALRYIKGKNIKSKCWNMCNHYGRSNMQLNLWDITKRKFIIQNL